MTDGSTASATCGTCISSTSSAASAAPRDPASAATSPASMLAPSALVATGPSVPSAAAVIRVVVDLPLVPVTTTVRRPAASWRRIDLSRVIATRPPIIAPAPRPVTRDAHRAPAPAASATRPRAVTIPGSLNGGKSGHDTLLQRSGLKRNVGTPCHPEAMSSSWGRPAAEPGAGWAVVDVETSGFRPGSARVVSIAALALGDDGNVERSLYTLLNPGVDPGPTHVHGLTAEMLDGQPRFGDIVEDLLAVLHGRTLVAHNVGFDYAFLAAEAELIGAELPIDSAMCTVELARRLELGTENLRLETLAAHWGITQMRPHDALDDALVLAQILKPVLVRARERRVWLPLRPVTRRRWPNGQVTHDEMRPLKVLASRLPCLFSNPGRYVAGRPLVQGMRVALSAEVRRTHEEL